MGPCFIRDRGYKTSYHPLNAPSQPDGLPEAHLSNHITQPGCGCWLAYKKKLFWSPLVSPLTLPQNPLAQPRARWKSNFLTARKQPLARATSHKRQRTTPQHVSHCRNYLTPFHTPSSFFFLGGGIYKGVGTPRPRRTPTWLPSHTKSGRGPRSPLLLRATNHLKSHVLTTCCMEPDHLPLPHCTSTPSTRLTYSQN